MFFNPNESNLASSKPRWFEIKLKEERISRWDQKKEKGEGKKDSNLNSRTWEKSGKRISREGNLIWLFFKLKVVSWGLFVWISKNTLCSSIWLTFSAMLSDLELKKVFRIKFNKMWKKEEREKTWKTRGDWQIRMAFAGQDVGKVAVNSLYQPHSFQI